MCPAFVLGNDVGTQLQLPLIAVPNTGQVVIIYYPSLRPPPPSFLTA